ncbi:MAG TPA: Gfo/Idh/MocA family oxidoreductase [Anaerolineae bacterium]|nr:Gfo/Idh/MocA family oxidoreductase [Anaerolineae bacterium]HXV98061.1 Gfo/Idh/MocA family oxidoreductase [Anaerolineae bacterium]
MANLKFAVIGAGFWSHYQTAAWFEVRGVQLAAVCDLDRSKAEKLAARFNTPKVYDDAKTMFQQEKLDFVEVITEVPGHAPLVLMAAKYKVPVICQKPMAADYETCQTMVQACREAGVPFMIHENFRWQVPMRAVKQILDQGRIGQPFRARLSFVQNFPVFENQPFLKTLNHFALTDVGSHILDLARFFFGEPQSLYCQTYRTRDDIAGEDVASVMLRIGDVICECEHSFATYTEYPVFPETLVYIEGKQGTLDLTPSFWIRVTTDEGTFSKRYAPPRYPWANPDYDVAHASLVPTNANMLQYIKTGQPAETSGEDNLKTMRLVYSAYESAERNQVIKLD